MLRVYQSVNAAQAKDYFSKELTQGDYYTEGQEIAGSWGGKGAQMLGLSGEVTQAAFNQLVDNINPNNGERLTPHNKGNRRPGYDLTFNAPKALSVLYEYSRDDRLLDAFRDSVHETMEEIEKAMHVRVRKDGQNEDRQTTNLVYGSFEHYTARPVEGAAPDPHLHMHCFVMNASFDDVEGKWKAGQFGEIKRDAPYYEAIFHSHLSGRLSELGLDIRRDGKFWTLEGIDKVTLDKYSGRTAEIESAAKEQNIKSAKAKDLLGAKLRGAKTEGLSRDVLRDIWWDRLDKGEREILDRLSEFTPDDDPQNSGEARAKLAGKYVDYAINHNLERQSVVPLTRLKETALREGFGQVAPGDIEMEVAARGDLIKVKQYGREFVTTKEVLNEEQDIIDFTARGYGTQDKLNPDYDITKVTDYKSGREFDLGDEQKKAVTDILHSRHRVMAIEGKAGAGKTTMLAGLINGVEQGGGKALVLAPTASAAYDTLRGDGEAYKVGPMESARTLARYFADKNLWEESKGSLLIVDEAGLMSVRDMHTLFAVASRYDNRILLVGDTGQHSSVMRGDALRILQKEAGLETITLENIRRQTGNYRRAVNALSKGNVMDGFDRLDAMSAVIEEGDDDLRYKNLAEKYTDYAKKGENTLVVAPTHAEGKVVTEEIRRSLKMRGLIKEEEHTVTRYKNLQLTEAEKTSPHNYREGQMIRYRQNAKGGIRRGTQLTVTGIDNDIIRVTDREGQEHVLDVTQGLRFNVYVKEEIGLSCGDRIRITEGGKAKDGKRLNNGSIYTVNNIEKNGDVVLDGGMVLDGDQGNIAHGYVTTSHASQGRTVKHILIAQSTDYSGAASAQQFYVSVSRGKKTVEIFTDNKEELREQIRQSHQRISATELTKSRPDSTKAELDMMSAMEFYARYGNGNLSTPFRPPPSNDISWQDKVTKDRSRGLSRE